MKHVILPILFISLLLSCSTKEGPAAKKDSPVLRAQVTYLAGDVLLERAGKSEAMTVGRDLISSDSITTGKNSSVDILIQGYGIVKLGSEARLELTSLVSSGSGSEAKLKLDQGDLASFIKKKDANANYSVVTPTAIAGVRGTSFLTSVTRNGDEPPKVNIAVLSGSVAVSREGQEEVILNENTQISISKEKKLAKDMIKPLSSDSLKAMQKLAVFHRSSILEFNTLAEEIKKSSPDLAKLEGESDLESSSAKRDAKTSSAEDTVVKAGKAEVSKHVSRDTESDPVKLKPQKTYK